MYHWSDGQEIQIGKGKIRICSKIFVADIAATDHCYQIIHGKGFIMHAPGYRVEPGEKLCLTHGIATEWIKNPYVDIWMTGKYSQVFISVAQVDIIKEHANPGAAVSSLEPLVSKQSTGKIAVNHVILGIDTSVCILGQGHSGGKGIQAFTEQQKTRFISRTFFKFKVFFAQSGICRILEGIGFRIGIIRRQLGTAAHQQQDSDDKEVGYIKGELFSILMHVFNVCCLC